MENKEITRAILGQVAALLVQVGFKKKGSTFLKDCGDVVHMVGLQKSMGSTAQEVKATVNLGVWIKTLAPIRAGKPDPPRLSEAHWRKRIGFLLPDRSDKWWFADSHALAVAVSSEIADALSGYGLPTLRVLSTTEALVDLWNSGSSPGLTAFQRDNYLQKLRNQHERNA